MMKGGLTPCARCTQGWYVSRVCYQRLEQYVEESL